MTEKSPLVIEELETFQLSAAEVFDPVDLNGLIFHSTEKGFYPDYPPVVYCSFFRNIVPRTENTPEQTVSLRKISLPENSPEEASIVPAHLLESTDYRFMSPAHILPLARSIIDRERQKWKNAIQSQQHHEIPWRGGKQHTLFYAFMVDKRFTLNLVKVDFDWHDNDTFGLGIYCLDPGDSYGELVLASYIEKRVS